MVYANFSRRKISSHYIWKLCISFGGVFPKKIKVLLLILESYNAFVGVFH